MSKADEAKVEFEKFKQNMNKGSNKGQGPTKEAATKGKFKPSRYVEEPSKTQPNAKASPTPYQADF